MKRPAWLNGPVFELKPMFRWAWAFLMLMTLGCTFAVIVKGDLWLMAAMGPGVFLASTMPWFFDARYKNSEAEHEKS